MSAICGGLNHVVMVRISGCDRPNPDTARLPDAASEPLRKPLASKCFRNEIDKDARLGRHLPPAGMVDRDRSRVGVPLRHQPHESAALKVPANAVCGRALLLGWSSDPHRPAIVSVLDWGSVMSSLSQRLGPVEL
jgi:hypothetical protein